MKTTEKLNELNKHSSGCKYIGFYKGIFSFVKHNNNGYIIINCCLYQLFNGDIEFMLENNLSLSDNMINNIKGNYNPKIDGF